MLRWRVFWVIENNIAGFRQLQVGILILPMLLRGRALKNNVIGREGVPHLEHAAFHPRVPAPRAPKAKRRFIAGFLTLCRQAGQCSVVHNVEAELSRGALQHNVVRGLQ